MKKESLWQTKLVIPSRERRTCGEYEAIVKLKFEDASRGQSVSRLRKQLRQDNEILRKE